MRTRQVQWIANSFKVCILNCRLCWHVPISTIAIININSRWLQTKSIHQSLEETFLHFEHISHKHTNESFFLAEFHFYTKLFSSSQIPEISVLVEMLAANCVLRLNQNKDTVNANPKKPNQHLRLLGLDRITWLKQIYECTESNL